MHQKNIIHWDIKPENIFIDKNNIIKIGDFGWSKELISGESNRTFCGTYEYMAPEILKGQA